MAPAIDIDDDEWSDTSSDESIEEPPVCETCDKEGTEEKPLKRCSRCHTVRYCSKECQSQDWKQHKRTCGKPEKPSIINTWLDGRPEQEVFTLLIDCFRMRVEDDYVFSGDIDEDSLYGGAPDSYKPFKRFLKKAAKCKGLLPSWWTEAKAQECLKVSMTHEWSNLKYAVEKSDIQDHYKDPTMPMQLRMLGEKIYGSLPGYSF